MSLIIKNKPKGLEFDPIPPVEEGIVNALCIGVFDIGSHYNERFQKHNQEIVIFFEVEHVIPTEGEYKGKRYVLSKRFTASLSEKSNLSKFLDSWGVAKIRSLEGKEFDLSTLVGKPALVLVGHETGGEGKVYARINVITPLQKVHKPLEMENIGYAAPKWIKTLQEKGKVA